MCQEKGKLQEEVKRLQQMLAQMTVAKLVQQPPAPPVPAVQEAPVEDEAEEEEDPEEREFYNSSDESVGSVESTDRKSTRLNSSHRSLSRMPSSA